MRKTLAAALVSGQIDGTVLQYPGSGVMEKKGFKIIDNAADLLDVPNTSYVTSRAYLKANRDVAKRFFMALIEGIHAYKTEPGQRGLAVRAAPPFPSTRPRRLAATLRTSRSERRLSDPPTRGT